MFARTIPKSLASHASISRCFSAASVRRIPEVVNTTTPAAPAAPVHSPITRIVPNPASRPVIDRSQTPLVLDIPLPKPTSEKYTITRTPSKQLPVYELRKGGGTLKLTRVRKIGGEKEVLKEQLEKFLVPKPEYVKINPLTGHVVIKGFYKNQIDEFLRDKGF